MSSDSFGFKKVVKVLGVFRCTIQQSVHGAGFDVLYRDMKEPMPERLRPLLGECWPMFELLRRHAITPLADEGVIPRSPK